MINQKGVFSSSANNDELLLLLKKVDPATILGSCIRTALANNLDEMLLVKELKSISDHNADGLRLVIGERAYSLLVKTRE